MDVSTGVNLISVPWYVGVEKGIWIKHGLDVKLKALPTGADLAKSLAAKDSDFSQAVNASLLAAAEQGLPLIVLCSAVGDATRSFADEAFTLIGGPNVKTIQDLSGKRLGMVAQGTSPPFLRSILKKNGIDPAQVEILNVPQANHPRMLATGQIDALVTIEPFGVLALDQTQGATLLVRGGGNVSFASTVVTRPDVIQSDPDTVQRFVDGFAESAAWIRQNQDEAAAVAVRSLTGLDESATKRSIQYLYYDPRVSRFTVEGLEADMGALLEAKSMKERIDLSKSMDLRFLNKTLETHPEYFRDLKPAETLR